MMKMANKPKFRSQCAGRKQIKDRWRKPKGINSKQKVNKRGKGPRVKIGYASGTHAPLPVRIFRPEDVAKAKGAAKVLIAAGVGGRKREAIMKKAKEMGVKIANAKE